MGGLRTLNFASHIGAVEIKQSELGNDDRIGSGGWKWLYPLLLVEVLLRHVIG